ncbi:hypothetical protein K457DRAFT_748894 [Linnemannia elongata AG-77]|uniref:Uncharacterized protein n=1 Tax=Linnemannia elongata AG-77 TaxID=1314771 RepID=A0A197JMS9_9FUNG|nr:hypothetical protein K457DRAFT_748894 [Linnemannia elongata AG-77]
MGTRPYPLHPILLSFVFSDIRVLCFFLFLIFYPSLPRHSCLIHPILSSAQYIPQVHISLHPFFFAWRQNNNNGNTSCATSFLAVR